MIEITARVTRIEGETAWVRVESPSSCGACAGKGCGSSVYARLLNPREPEYPVENQIHACTGEAVVIGIEDGAILKAVFAGYLLPLALLLAGALFGNFWGDAGSALGAVAGLLLAVFWLRQRTRGAVPVLLRHGEVACSSRA